MTAAPLHRAPTFTPTAAFCSSVPSAFAFDAQRLVVFINVSSDSGGEVGARQKERDWHRQRSEVLV